MTRVYAINNEACNYFRVPRRVAAFVLDVDVVLVAVERNTVFRATVTNRLIRDGGTCGEGEGKGRDKGGKLKVWRLRRAEADEGATLRRRRRRSRSRRRLG